MQGWFNIWKSTNIIQHVNRVKDKKAQDHLNRCRKSLKNSTCLHGELPKEIRNIINVLPYNEGYYDKPITNIIINSEKLKPFPLKSETRQYCLLSPLLLNIVIEFLARAIK
jgi:hypothetical protein